MADSLSRALVSVRAKSKALPAPVQVFARSSQFTVEQPWSFDPQEPSTTGAERLLGILVGEIIHIFQKLAAEKRLDIDQIEGTASCVLNDTLRFLGVIGVEGEPAYENFSIKVFISSPEDANKLEAIWNEAVHRAPLVRTMRRSTTVDLQLEHIY
ncbi:MAG: hypothetical protein R3C03_19740 [Pirellulaceae bacterium]